MRALVGYTGFVGSNLDRQGDFDCRYNSKNIADAFGTEPDILYFAGVPAQKFIADKFPRQDRAIIDTAIENIKKISPKKTVLISTVDVYSDTAGKTEDDIPGENSLGGYGLNRLYFEKEIRKLYPDALIVRLPGLYGKNLKKNFIYDYINYVPALLKNEKIDELSRKNPDLKSYYSDRGDGFWALRENRDKKRLRPIFENLGFSALNFTDSRGIFQYYNLKYLYDDIQIAIDNNITLLNVATEPIEIGALHKILCGKDFENHISRRAPFYDFRTKHAGLFGGEGEYMQSAEFVYKDIKKFVGENL